jgi:hypothetical protein
MRDYHPKEFTMQEPCGEHVIGMDSRMMGFCSREVGHGGGHSHLVPASVIHDLRHECDETCEGLVLP